MRNTSRRLIAGIAIGAAAFAAVSVYGDAHQLGDRLTGFRWTALFAALGLALVNYAIRFARWQGYLHARDLNIPRRTSLLVFGSGFALSLTPGKVGELVKSYLLRETHRIPIARSAPIVVAERVTDLIALLALALCGVAAYGIAIEVVAAGGAIIGLGLTALAWPRLGFGIIAAVSRLPRMSAAGEHLRVFYRGFTQLMRWPCLAWSTALAIAAWLAECVGFALIVAAFPGTFVPLGLATLIYATTTIAGALSFLPGGLLVTEATMTLFLVQASRGVDEPTAAAATILTRLATLWFAVLLGSIALAQLRWRLPRTERAMQD